MVHTTLLHKYRVLFAVGNRATMCKIVEQSFDQWNRLTPQNGRKLRKRIPVVLKTERG